MNEKLKAAMSAAIKKKEITLSDGNRVVVRPMLVKELKIMSANVESHKDPLDFMADVVKSCIVEGKVDIATLPLFDYEKLLFDILKLGRLSPIISVPFVCKNEIDGKECGTEIKVDSNLNTVRLSREPDSLVKLNNMVSVKMRYPNMTEISYFDTESYADAFDLAWRLVEEVHFNGSIMKVGIDIKAEDLIDLSGYVSAEEMKPMFDFTNNMPRLVMDVAVKCPCCGYHEPIRLTGIDEIMYEAK
ncbi:T4 family baseplate hub assembly chaperone [Aeromonas salmonicida]